MVLPREERAFLHPGGLSLSSFHLPLRDLLFLLRTGFPRELEPWQIVSGASTSGSAVEWAFSGGRDTLRVRLEPPELFPGSIEWGGGSASVLSASPHDEYEAWPSSWRFESGDLTAVLSISSIRSPAEAWQGVWDLAVPFPAETLKASPSVEPLWEIPRR